MADLLSVAKFAGVSRATAARAFSSPDLVRPATRERVLNAAQQLAFRPNKVAQQLRSQATQMIGVMVPSLDNPVFAEQLQAMEVAARASGYSLIVTTSEYSPSREGDIVEEMLRQRVDGLVLTVAEADNSAVLDKLRLETTPCLLVYNPPGNSDFPSVGVDNRAASADATRHLIALGHKRIGMVAGPLLQSDRAQQRFEGYCHAMDEAGLMPRPLVEMTRHTQADLVSLTPALKGANALTGVICTNDLLAISLMGELQRAGFRVPDDLSVMGFDGIALGKHLYPSLCTIEQPRAEIGRSAVHTLLAMIRGERCTPAPLPHAMRKGESAGTPASR
ncbi:MULTISPECIES: substrate-binding domain-containing protein [unclassified Halomonas]|uniref:substrate-binding domain-containing protein n=1 Tax=unclassified Halomonas TaxID=2609666 RepID=UPI0006DB471E|nr:MULTISPECIES: substrate-binding domain-containing protein [unclassified Halomonas]KPQ22248.1 MAG: LacI family transcriptional regulator, repressor for deo operon, udp, cdd, tsx, nupC, and nupG [Halomonas sp. HL-93]SBR48193.1 transcriptional regulator, LacI family [Halomonas sp. HL-93]SNY95794.1 transcriptional regulator, LacI family [Halomonas sp. hl-4]